MSDERIYYDYVVFKTAQMKLGGIAGASVDTFHSKDGYDIWREGDTVFCMHPDSPVLSENHMSNVSKLHRARTELTRSEMGGYPGVLGAVPEVVTLKPPPKSKGASK